MRNELDEMNELVATQAAQEQFLTQEILAARLKDARVKAGLTQEQAAESLGVTRTAITHLENGNRKASTLELASLAELYGRTISSFFD